MHIVTHRRQCQPCKAGAVRVRRLAQGHLDTLSKLTVTSQPALPPELVLPGHAQTTASYSPLTAEFS